MVDRPTRGNGKVRHVCVILTVTAPNQTLHHLAIAGVIGGIALETFDGFGGGHQKDFVMLNGINGRSKANVSKSSCFGVIQRIGALTRIHAARG